MNKLLRYCISLPKTLYVNFRHLPFSQALKLPLAVSYDTDVRIKGRIEFGESVKLKRSMVRVGFLMLNACDTNEKTRLYIEHGGTLHFDGEAHLGHGSRIVVRKNAYLFLGNNFSISQNTTIQCYKKITFGCDIQFSWECLVMDCDTHTILTPSGREQLISKEISFGDKIWIGCRSTILKGAEIPSNTVIGACSFVSGKEFRENTIIVGHPAKSVKEIGGWHL